MASGLSTSGPGGVQRRVHAVGTAPPRGIAHTGGRSPTGPSLGPRSAYICRSVASSAGTQPACGGFLPSGFPPSSRSVVAIVWACVQPSVRWASRWAAVPAHGSCTPWASRGVTGRWCAVSIGRPCPFLRPHGSSGSTNGPGGEGDAWGPLCGISSAIRSLIGSPFAQPHRSRRGCRRTRVLKSSAALGVGSLPKGVGTEPHRRSRSSSGVTWCRLWAMPWSGSFAALGRTSTPAGLHGLGPQSQRSRLP
jgi:hypothetical protein